MLNLRQLIYKNNTFKNIDYNNYDYNEYKDIEYKLLVFNENYNYYNLFEYYITVYDEDYYNTYVKTLTSTDNELLICKIHQDCYRIHNNKFPQVKNIELTLHEIIIKIMEYEDKYGKL